MVPDEQKTSAMWRHVRRRFQADLWIWLGDNAYADGEDMDKKRRKYNEIRDDKYYKKYGPVASPHIPVMGSWDDHDFGSNDQGNEYKCKLESQLEYCIHFNIPRKDPRCRGRRDVNKIERKGVYGSIVYPLPERYANLTGTVDDNNTDTATGTKTDEDNTATASPARRGGIHVINLDTRSERHRVSTRKGEEKCYRRGGGESSTDILSPEQWNWLENELLTIPSEIKVITSGIQVLPPTNLRKGYEFFCAYDGKNGTFERAIDELDEGKDTRSGVKRTLREIWGDVPQARLRLLQLAQRSVNAGKTKTVIFVSGNAHMGEIMAKRMPESFVGGSATTLYEVTASGVGKMKYSPYPNAHRVRVRSCDDRGNGNFVRECDFPFIWRNKTYNDCTLDTYGSDSTKREEGRPWCYYRTKDNRRYEPKAWGYCLPVEEEIVPRENQLVSRRTCGRSYHQTCGMTNIYGGVDVNWDAGEVVMSVFTPGEEGLRNGLASSITVPFVPDWMETKGHGRNIFF
mmetsp:Transcript_36137/g.44212  ORF Transcript_36137/g.44212 Transcript_36137/m.44212 type:complete len:514 (+) Transcript_36137:425-1966(+)